MKKVNVYRYRLQNSYCNSFDYKLKEVLTITKKTAHQLAWNYYFSRQLAHSSTMIQVTSWCRNVRELIRVYQGGRKDGRGN